jgi:ribulose-phosphate 3-epimerase
MNYEDIKIAPSILAADFTKLGEQVRDAQSAGADLIHIDVMDGRFVPNITMGPLVVRAVKQVVTIPLDVHLMIIEPERYIQEFADAGADAITVHIEASPHLHRALSQIKDAGCKVGVAINPHTPADALSEVLDMLDIINVMTVDPGFGGQKFIHRMTSKIAKLRAMIRNEHLNVDIEVDGGINVETITSAVQSGANIMIAGSCIFGHDDGIKAGIDALRQALHAEVNDIQSSS